MKRKGYLFFVLCNIIIFFTSCVGTKDYVNEVLIKEAIIDPKNKTIVVTAVDNLKLNNYVKTFKKNYKNKRDFINSYNKEFLDENKTNATFSEIKLANFNKWSSLKKNSIADYIINFYDFEITNRIENRDYSSGNSYNHAVSIEYCVVNVKVVVYDVKKKKEVLEFVSTGESAISFFNYSKSLAKSKSRSITHIINYLKSGKINYKGY